MGDGSVRGLERTMDKDLFIRMSGIADGEQPGTSP